MKGSNMEKYDHLDPTNEHDQKYILRKVGEVMADITATDPSDVASDMGMPECVTEWLDEVEAYFLIEARIDCQ
jgi:hypothetical protein